MSTPHSVDAQFFLNRIALHTMNDPYLAGPSELLDQIMDFAGPDELQDMFRELSDAAIKSSPNWKAGEPGNLLFISQKLEMLIECCFLLQTGNISISPGKENAVSTFKHFFQELPLPQWKFYLHEWCEAALSTESIWENEERDTLERYRVLLNNLLDAVLIFIRE